MPLVTIRTPLRPTEDPEKVRKAILNLFPDSEITIDKDERHWQRPSPWNGSRP